MTHDSAPTQRWMSVLGWGFLLFVIGLWVTETMFGTERRSALVGDACPSFDAVIAAGDGASSGDRVSLESLRGQVVILDFWASWCAPCRASMPIVSALANRHREAGLVTFGVNVESERDRSFVARAHRALGATFPSLHDENDEMQSTFGIASIPTLVLIDRRGIVRHVEVGVPSEAELEAEIVALLEENH
jgi:thiol-disulfide isomerase/thioredoxin